MEQRHIPYRRTVAKPYPPRQILWNYRGALQNISDNKGSLPHNRMFRQIGLPPLRAAVRPRNLLSYQISEPGT